MKKLISCLVLGLSLASFAGEKAMGDKPAAEKGSKKKAKKEKTEKKGEEAPKTAEPPK